MKNISIILPILLFCLIMEPYATGQPLTVSDRYLHIRATADDPLYTTYAATMERSRLYGDKAYKMDYYTDAYPLNYSSDQSGKMYNIWKINQVVVNKMAEYFVRPTVVASFPDMALVEYKPFRGIDVQELFFVFSSKTALVRMLVTNTDSITRDVEVYPVIDMNKNTLFVENWDRLNDAYLTRRYETKKRLISNLYAKAPYPTDVIDLFTANFNVYSHGGYDETPEEFYNTIKTDWYAEDRNDSLNGISETMVRLIALHGKFTLRPGQSADIRYFRGIQGQQEDVESLMEEINMLKTRDLQPFVDANTELFASIPRLMPEEREQKLVYLGALNLVRSCMLPPTGKTNYNFYVFSRNPVWGWGHGHQVLHESLSMMAYVYLDALSAEGSQRVYMEQQGDDGLIAYRHGPRGAQTYPHKGKPTTSAPFFSWINWEVYQVSGDKEFLSDAYRSGVEYTEWLFDNRDTDGDGLFEWGPYGIIENVRDWYNAVFQVSAERYLDVDKEDISDELECLDLSLMVVKELRSLSKMADALGKKKAARKWTQKADDISEKINNLMWDEETGFYYHINKKDHSWYFMGRDLRRREIIGFLPLWAEACPPDRAARLVKTLIDPDKFWRKYGVPTLAADDPWYSPWVDYCCKWNGPVWLLWDYMVFEGLINYGYDDLARQLAEKMLLAVTTQLKKNHNYWESYSPDNEVLNCPSNYIWDSIMARLLIRLQELN